MVTMQPSEPLYKQTSQYRNWRFSPEQLHEIRQSTHQAGVLRARKNIHAERDELQRRSLLVPEQTEDQVKYLSVDDELTLCNYYENMADNYARHFKQPHLVKATAITFMKRFFLFNTVMDYPPKNIMLTCLYLATKTENRFIQIEDFVKPIPKVTTKDILDYEFTVCQGLKFEFTVHHPYSALYGYFLDCQNNIKSMALLTQVYNKAMDWCHKSIFTDLMFIYFPSQIALACMKLAGQELDWDIDVYLRQKFPDGNTVQRLDIMVDHITFILKEYKSPTPNVVRDIDRRLTFCRNPEKDPSRILYQKQQQLEHEQKSVDTPQGESSPRTEATDSSQEATK
ncbi:hypothetical protein IWQ61_004958 [Dispira simplex]|nr:hypothetical protein IWQ61_004958 [Dispira simplex]